MAAAKFNFTNQIIEQGKEHIKVSDITKSQSRRLNAHKMAGI